MQQRPGRKSRGADTIARTAARGRAKDCDRLAVACAAASWTCPCVARRSERGRRVLLRAGHLPPHTPMGGNAAPPSPRDRRRPTQAFDQMRVDESLDVAVWGA
eukprot:361401-Chlamydomonas_euryale.AAC.2